ncbi:Repressible high-affinity phosphate permease [Fusarium oxysporum]|uniref:Repressible high-affinity phosphate permease n=1 Tax=Fusarium oxysporum TaxID=5507 RepID=A0A420RE64_FUSOX|nr:Repressible high-affinity phosphate permease [Fusarium oxysporum]
MAATPGPVAKTSGGNNAFHNFHNDFAHIADPNERRRLALAEIDKAPFGWYHVRACVVAGVGFFTDSYDIFCVSMLTIMLGIVYYPGKGKLATSSDNAIKLSTSAGTVIGQLGFGMLADIVGRKRMYGLELIVIIFATLAQALTAGSPSTSLVGLIIFWRVVMGVGIGGDYPLSSIITSEFATTKWRGAMMAAVFAMQGIGQLVAALVMMFLTLGFKSSLESAPDTKHCTGDCQVAVDKMWRTLVGFGAVPACIALYYRLTIPETPRYTFDVARDVEQADEDVKAYMTGKREGDTDEIARAQVHASAKSNLQVPKASWSDFCQHYSKWKNLSILIGTAGSWFCLDVAFYGLSLNNGTILKVIGYSSKDANNMYEFLYNTAVGNIIIVLAGAVPGYWVSVATIDTLGRKTIQLGGFIILTILFIVSPNTTTFIVPGEVFPTRYRSTSHGISAASGKIGSIIGQGAISILRTHGATDKNEAPWMDHVLEIYALFMLLGIFTTLLIPETARKTLEELSGEDDYANNPETTIDSEAHAGKNEGTSV